MILRKILGIPLVYDLWQLFAGDKKRHKILISQYIGDIRGKAILELGCGTADLLQYLHPDSYKGIDMDESYIAKAKKKYSNREEVSFEVADVNEYAQKCNCKYDLILMIGVIHHLTDDEVNHCFASICNLLNDGGYLITADGVYVDGMRRFERWLLDMDRGEHVRNLKEYKKLHHHAFKNVHYKVRKDLMHLPFYIVIFKDQML